MSGREIRRVRSTEAEDSPEGDPTGRSPRREAGWAEHGKVFSVRGAERFAGSSPALPTTVRLVNAPVVSPSLRRGNSPSDVWQSGKTLDGPDRRALRGAGSSSGKERRRNARGCANAAKVRVRHPPAPPTPGWTHPGSTSEGCEAPSREDGAKRTRNGEAHNAPQAWSGPQRHGVSLPPRGMTPTLPLHHLFGAGGPLARGDLVRHRRSKRAYFMGPTASTPV